MPAHRGPSESAQIENEVGDDFGDYGEDFGDYGDDYDDYSDDFEDDETAILIIMTT